MNNEELLREARNGNTAALDTLLYRFKGLVKNSAGAYYIAGGDRDDIMQEGMIGLFKAVRDYNPEKQLSFYTFAKICVTRQIMSAIKASARLKHQPLNNSLPLDTPQEINALDSGRDNDPETLFIDREEQSDVGTFLQRNLSEMEYQVLTLHLQGLKHTDIARIVERSAKSVDNALQRVRRKIGGIVRGARVI